MNNRVVFSLLVERICADRDEGRAVVQTEGFHANERLTRFAVNSLIGIPICKTDGK